jgi:betaine/carnitine transporter, BCCT family
VAARCRRASERAGVQSAPGEDNGARGSPAGLGAPSRGRRHSVTTGRRDPDRAAAQGKDALHDRHQVEPIPEPEGPTEVIETDYEIGRDNIEKSWTLSFDIHQVVFTWSALSILAFIVLTLALQAEVEPLFTGLRDWLTANLDWFFLLSGNIFVIVCLALIVSPLGRIRLGGPEATPDYGYVGWFSMLFAAGMGIGLMFFGVSEPLSHFSAASTA